MRPPQPQERARFCAAQTLPPPRARIDGGICVRFGREGEKLKLLNDQEIALKADLLVIADRTSTNFGRAQLIHRMEDGYLAASEWRTDGQAVGF